MKKNITKYICIIGFLFIFVFMNQINDSSVSYASINDRINNYLTYNLISENDVVTYSGVLTASVSTSNTVDNTGTLYRDRIKKIIMTVNNVDYDVSNYTVTIKSPSGSDDSANWSVEKVKSGNSMSIVITRSQGYPTAGSYTITVTNNIYTTSKVSKSFTVVGYYNYFALSDITKTFGPGNANKANTWNLSLLNLSNYINDEVSSNSISAFSIKIENEKGIDVTSKNFEVSQTKELITIKNKTGFSNMPKSGIYTVTVTHTDSNYKATTRIQTKTFTISKKAIDINVTREESHRYIREMVDVKYKIKVANVTTSKVSYYYVEDGVSDNGKLLDMTPANFKKAYPNINTDSLTLKSNKVVFKYDDTLTITKILDDIVYFDLTENKTTTSTTLVLDEFIETYENAYNKLNEQYEVLSTGALVYVYDGITQVETKNLDPKNLNVFALSGGTIKKTATYKGVRADEFKSFEPYIVKAEDNGECAGNVCTEKEGFTLNCSYNPDTKDDESGSITCEVEYDNTDIKYAGVYKIILPFTDADERSISFELFDQDVDYYLTSEFDSHMFKDDELDSGVAPPSNKRYEYYLGFYLIKGGKKQTTRSGGTIRTRIFDHHVDLKKDKQGNTLTDSSGNPILRYYDVDSYQIRLINYNKTTEVVKYAISINGSDFAEKTATYSEFASMYQIDEEFPTCGEDNFLGCYKFNDDGSLNTEDDNFNFVDANNTIKMVVKKFASNSSQTDVDVVFDLYDKDGNLSKANTNKKLSLEKFKVQYPDMYNYVITKFIFDEEGNIIRGTFMGSYDVYEINGKEIEGHELTDEFNITVDDDLTNVDKAVTILPKTEVESGTYYVYSTYETMESIGYVNKNGEDELGNEVEATISKSLYPEMWLQNTHMTSITYEKPVYDLSVESTELTNSRNSENKMYYNVESYGLFNIKTNYVYSSVDANNNSLFDVSVKYYNGTNYVDVTNNFNINTNFVMPEEGTESHSTVKITSKVGSVKKGKYKLIVNYQNNGGSGQCESEFEIPSKYYDIDIETDSFAYAKNVSKQVTINTITHFVDNIDEITPSIEKVITANTSEVLILDKNNKTFSNKNGEVLFTYTYNSSNIDSEIKNYQFILKNVKDKAEIGEYVLKFSYQESDNDLITRSINFDVTKEQYIVELSNRTPKVNDDGMFIYYDILTKYIDGYELDKIKYTIYYYDLEEKKYIDVSSESSTRKMFKIRDTWDLNTNPDYEGKLIIELIENNVDMNGTYIIKVKYSSSESEYELTDYGKTLKSLFEWKIDSVDITSVYNEEDEDIKVDGFYSNLKDITIKSTITSPYEKSISWVINKECVNGVCDPTLGANYNDRFTVDNKVLTDKTLTLKLKDNLSDNLKLEEGTYALVLYYSATDYKVYTFEVLDEYIIIEMNKENTLIYSRIDDDTVSDGLFSNKSGKIYIPVKIIGPKYSNENIQIRITNENGTVNYEEYFPFSRVNFNSTHNLEIDYDPLKQVESGKYMITIEYANYKRVIKDSLVFTVNQTYFNFYFKDKTYSTNPLIPNDGGTITYKIDTEDIPNIQISSSQLDEDTNKHVFSRNTKIYDSENNDVTNAFSINATNTSDNLTSFFLNIHYEKNAVSPGEYKVVTSYTMDGYLREKEETFEIGNYRKDFEIKETKIKTSALDGRMHSNLENIFEIYLESNYEMFASFMKVQIFYGDTDITNKFTIEKYDDLIKIISSKNSLDTGNYIVKLTYQEDDFNVIRTTDYVMNGEYKEIKISNMTPSNSFIYSDVENMSYSMDVYTTVEEENMSKLKARIYDEENNLVYSDISTDNLTNSFELINKVNENGKYVINIIPFKARIGSYYIELYYFESSDSYSLSNKLEFTIDKNYYKVTLSNDSYIKNVIDYGDSLIYDIDGAEGMYKFTSTYNNDIKDVYSIGVYNGLTLVDKVDINIEEIEENGVKYFKSNFKTNELIPSSLDFYLCINGLPYEKITEDVNKYIKIDEFNLVIDNKYVDILEVFNGQFKDINYVVNPTNYTDKAIKITSTNENVIKVLDDGRLRVTGVGNAELIIKNRDYTKTIQVISKERLSSNVYSINYDNNTIYVLNMNSKSLSKQEFVNNLIGLVSNYKVLDKDNNDITNSGKSIGTSMSIINDIDTYKIVVIGDLNKDGKINVMDVSMLYSYVRGKISLDEYSMAAANIRKQNDIKVADVSKLYSFVRDRISGI